jgi:hypothetical protein
VSVATFPLGDVLTVTTGRLASPSGMDGVYKILNHLTGDTLVTHQLPRAGDFAKPHLLALFPALAGADLALLSNLLAGAKKGTERAAVDAWVEIEAQRFGATLDLPSFATEWQSMNPIDEIVAMRAEVS